MTSWGVLHTIGANEAESWLWGADIASEIASEKVSSDLSLIKQGLHNSKYQQQRNYSKSFAAFDGCTNNIPH